MSALLTTALGLLLLRPVRRLLLWLLTGLISGRRAFLLTALCPLFFRPIRGLIQRLLWGKAQGTMEHDELQLAEVEGEKGTRISVYEHIEHGLKTNPNGPAVICMFQAANHLDSLLSSEDVVHVPKQFTKLGHGTASPIHCLCLSYAQLRYAALRVASGLVANGARPNTTMLLVIPNGGEYAVLLWACVLLRITYSLVHPALLDVSGFTTLKQTLRQLRPQVVVAPDPASARAIDVAVAELQIAQPVRVCLLARVAGGVAADNAGGGGGGGYAPWLPLATVAAHGAKRPLDEAALAGAARTADPRALHSVMFTSGTSGGAPKGCPARNGAMAHALHSQAWLVDGEAAALALMQPHNSRGIAPAQTLQTWKAGGCVVLSGQELNVAALAEAVRRLGVSFVVLSPPMVHEIAAEIAAARLDVGCVRTVQVGGDAVTRNVLLKCAALFPAARVCVNHGMTEAIGSFVWPFSATPVSLIPFFGEICPVGTVAPGASVRIVHTDTRRLLEKGQLGELQVSSPSLIAGYWNGLHGEYFHRDAHGRVWFATGDIGVVDNDGLVFILGRKKDMIKQGSAIIMPAVIESLVEAYTGTQTIVVPVPHHVLGVEPFAVISGYEPGSERCIKDHVRAVLGSNYSLGGLSSLKQLGLMEFPVNLTHKIIKSDVRKAVLKYMRA
ncbi:hypothetical protein GGR56DRAFT_684235 [Xylariaceae sp. FL0804]|nr:hypothetical protein GGR56DRAFT_684235 [Xylariaceae sp. FL0804]